MDRFTVRQLIRYGIAGLASNAAGYIPYLLITHAGIDPKKTVTTHYAIGATIGFIGNRKLALTHCGSVSACALRYALAHLLGYLLNISILIIFIDMMGYAQQLVQAVAIFVFPKNNLESVGS